MSTARVSRPATRETADLAALIAPHPTPLWVVLLVGVNVDEVIVVTAPAYRQPVRSADAAARLALDVAEGVREEVMDSARVLYGVYTQEPPDVGELSHYVVFNGGNLVDHPAVVGVFLPGNWSGMSAWNEAGTWGVT